MSEEFSESERHGLVLITGNEEAILSVGISTAGKAEIEMIRRAPNAHIIATTLDENGVGHTQALLHRKGLTDKIEVRYEDVSEPLPYEDSSIDFIYARLVLHYLSKQKLESTLRELSRVMKPASKLYVVVRSVECDDMKLRGISFDEVTGLTTYQGSKPSGEKYSAQRFFHSKDSINEYMQTHFKILSIKQYDEALFRDYERTIPSPNKDNLIEVIAEKEV